MNSSFVVFPKDGSTFINYFSPKLTKALTLIASLSWKQDVVDIQGLLKGLEAIKYTFRRSFSTSC